MGLASSEYIGNSMCNPMLGGMAVKEVQQDVRKPWLKHYPEEVPHSMDIPEHSIVHLLKMTATQSPHHNACEFFGRNTTYHQLMGKVYQFARTLKSLGIQKGDRVAIMLPNCPQAVVGYYGALLLGAVVVQINPLYVERELEYHLNDSGSTVLLSLDLLYPRISNVKNNTPLKHVILTSIKDELPFPKNVLYPLKLKKQGVKVDVPYTDSVLRYQDVMQTTGLEDPPEEPEIDAKTDLALLQYTGGTTGTAKGVMLTHYNLVANTLQCKAWFYNSTPGEEKMLAVLPFFHVYGMTVVMNLSVAIGATMILQPRFDPAEVLKAIDRSKPTIFPGAPTIYVALLQHPDLHKYRISSVKACLSGSAPLPLEVQQRFETETGGRLVEGYGLTEASPVTHANPIWGKRKDGTIGLPWPNTDCRIVDVDTGEDLPLPGQIGELVVKGPQVMQGYWGRPEETKEALKEGWLYTGDMASMDTDGFFTIVDRKKDMIIAGGFNIYPREIEEVLYEHPDIVEAAVVGIPDEYRGETVKAYVVAKEGMELNIEELDTYCRSKLAAYKVPRHYEFRKELPKSAIGKILRRKLLEEEKQQAESSGE